MRIFIIPVFFFYTLAAQEIIILEVRKLPAKGNEKYVVAGVSPDGKQVLATGSHYKGLHLIDVKSGKKQIITELAGAGSDPVFSPDGSYIFFKSDDFSSKRKLTSLYRIDVKTKDTVVMEKGARSISRPVITRNGLSYTADGQDQIKSIDGQKLKNAESETYVMLENLVPVLYSSGERKILKPGGNGSYIWVSLSPDKTKLLYSLAGKGTFISDLNGYVLDSLGQMNAPKWLNNNMVIGMNDKDNGEYITSSEIVAYSLVSKKVINITSTRDKHEMYPYPFPDGKRVAFSNSLGELFILDLKIR